MNPFNRPLEEALLMLRGAAKAAGLDRVELHVRPDGRWELYGQYAVANMAVAKGDVFDPSESWPDYSPLTKMQLDDFVEEATMNVAKYRRENEESYKPY